MKALTEKIIQECNISKTLRESAWLEEDFKKAQELRVKQQWHWEKFNFMKELSKALEREVKE
jgi:hypothetical protein